MFNDEKINKNISRVSKMVNKTKKQKTVSRSFVHNLSFQSIASQTAGVSERIKSAEANAG